MKNYIQKKKSSKYKYIAVLILMIPIITLGSKMWVQTFSKGRIFSKVKKIHKNKVGLLLGTSNRTIHGKENLYFTHRIDAAVKLYKFGKIDYILVSGDGMSDENYNEPNAMKKSLLEKGIPTDRIILDYKGMRTLDSVVRAKEIFGQDQVTVISQEFHNHRAIFIGFNRDIDVIAFNAKAVKGTGSHRTKYREYLARVKAMLDIYIFGTEPKYMGEPRIIR